MRAVGYGPNRNEIGAVPMRNTLSLAELDDRIAMLGETASKLLGVSERT